MAARTAPTAEDRDQPGRPRRRRRRLLAAAVLLPVVLAGAGATVLTGGPPDAEVSAPAEGEVLPVEQMTVNLAGGSRYARVAFAVVLAEGADAQAVITRFPLLQDAALSEIGAYTAERLISPEGQDQLRGGLTARAGALYPDGEVLRVVLTELLVQ